MVLTNIMETSYHQGRWSRMNVERYISFNDEDIM